MYHGFMLHHQLKFFFLFAINSHWGLRCHKPMVQTDPYMYVLSVMANHNNNNIVYYSCTCPCTLHYQDMSLLQNPFVGIRDCFQSYCECLEQEVICQARLECRVMIQLLLPCVKLQEVLSFYWNCRFFYMEWIFFNLMKLRTSIQVNAQMKQI